MLRVLLFLPVLFACGLQSASSAKEQHALRTLWQIGQSDNNTAEFAHAPADYQSYRTPGFFVVGVSDTRRDWPYVQPSTHDGEWAPSSPHSGGGQVFPAAYVGSETIDDKDVTLWYVAHVHYDSAFPFTAGPWIQLQGF